MPEDETIPIWFFVIAIVATIIFFIMGLFSGRTLQRRRFLNKLGRVAYV
jgi:hypothetical protein